jgi:Tfp pilus assembly protein PilW
MTLVELLVAMSAGVVVMVGITLAMIVTMRETSRVTSHVEANQQARIAMTKILAELHSACLAPQIAPIYPESSATTLNFIHQSGSAVAPVPVKSKIVLTEGMLKEFDYRYKSGLAPNYVFEEAAPESTEILLENASQIGTTPIFRYYTYSNGTISSTPLTVPLDTSRAATTVQVNVAFNSVPEKVVSKDSSAPTAIQDSALLRLTPPGYSTSSTNLPCQ